jgi:hypothetical protein
MKASLRIASGPIVIGLLILLSLAAGAGVINAKPKPLLPKSPLSGSVLMAQAIHSGTVKLAGQNAPAGKFNPNGLLGNVQASEGGLPVDEDPIAVDPTNGQNLLTGGNDYNCSNIQGFYASTNGGKSWNTTCLNNVGVSGCGDPVVGYDLTGAAYIGGLDCPPYGVVEKSTNHGQTWSSPVIAVTALQPSGFVDKDWLQVDDNPSSPGKNNVYISTTQFNSATTQSQIGVSHSTDGGTTWKTVAVDPLQPTGLIDQFSDLTVGKDGTVYVSWLRCNNSTGECAGNQGTFYVSKSTDFGNTWSTPRAIATVSLAPDACGCAYYGSLPNTSERVSDIPAIGIDTSTGAHAGNLYAVMYNWTGTYMEVEVATSTNGGSTWGKPVRVTPTSDTHDQFFPWLSVNTNGAVGVSWLDRRNDPSNISYETFASKSLDGGATFTNNVQVATAPSNPFNDGFGGTFMGDYTGNAWDGQVGVPSWMDTRTGINTQDEVGGWKCANKGC